MRDDPARSLVDSTRVVRLACRPVALCGRPVFKRPHAIPGWSSLGHGIHDDWLGEPLVSNCFSGPALRLRPLGPLRHGWGYASISWVLTRSMARHGSVLLP